MMVHMVHIAYTPLLSCYVVLVNKVPLVLHSPDMKLYNKRLHSYFHIVNSM